MTRAGGDFAAFLRAFFKNGDVHQLSDRAFRMLCTLKGLLPLAGIGEIYEWELVQCCACQAGEAEAALQELERAKPSGEFGWIRREGRVIWIVNGLAHAVGVTPNNRNHRAHVASQLGKLAKLAPRLVAAFRERYSEFGGEPTREASPGDPIRMGFVSHGDQVDGDGKVVPAVKAETETSASAPLVTSLWDLTSRFLDRHYYAASAKRRDDVNRQIAETVSPRGCVVRREPRQVAHATLATLERAIEACEASGAVTVPDRAIVVLLRKLVSGACNQVAPPGTEWAADQERARQPQVGPKLDGVSGNLRPSPGPPEPVHIDSAERELSQVWIDRHPGVQARLEADADAWCEQISGPRWRTLTRVVGVRARHLEELIVAAYRGTAAAPVDASASLLVTQP